MPKDVLLQISLSFLKNFRLLLLPAASIHWPGGFVPIPFVMVFRDDFFSWS